MDVLPEEGFFFLGRLTDFWGRLNILIRAVPTWASIEPDLRFDALFDWEDKVGRSAPYNFGGRFDTTLSGN